MDLPQVETLALGSERPERVGTGDVASGRERKELRILHFNDVYAIESHESKEVPGGIARFVTALAEAREQAKKDDAELLTVFSGDLLGPSSLSALTEGSQMIYPFNRCEVDVAMIGNHDLDFGVL